MKTGRIRKKETPPPAPEPASPTSSRPPRIAARPARAQARKPFRLGWLIAVPFVIFVVAMVLLIIFGGKKADDWVKVTRAEGTYTTTMTVFGPQVTVAERWEAECLDDPTCTIQAGTCVRRDTDRSREELADEYEEYAYNIYYEETYEQPYEARGAEFVTTSLGSDDWWQDEFHYVLQEVLDQESCQLTNYTVWVEDPANSAQEIEVYLSDCEVWDHVRVYERVYEQASWCKVDVTTMVQVAQQSESGAGYPIQWPQVAVPDGGRTEQAFEGRVTFLGDDYTYTASTTDADKYTGYLTDEYYLGLDDGEPFTVRQNPPD
jgi:hypothetical protein